MPDHLPTRSCTFIEAGRELSYQRLLNENNETDIFTARAIAAQRATREHEVLQKLGVTPSWQDCFDAELRRVLSDAADIRELRLARKAIHALPLREQLIRSAEWELHKARNGLGMPIDSDKVARLEEALGRIKEQSDQLQAAE
jgi:hypothetical protein